MVQTVSAVVVGADRLGNIPDLLKGHNIAIKHHISGRDPAHQKKTLQLPSGTDLLILLTDFLGHNVMKTFRAAAQRSGIKVLACRRSVCSMKQALTQSGYCEICQEQCPKKGADLNVVRFVDNARRYKGTKAYAS